MSDPLIAFLLALLTFIAEYGRRKKKAKGRTDCQEMVQGPDRCKANGAS